MNYSVIKNIDGSSVEGEPSVYTNIEIRNLNIYSYSVLGFHFKLLKKINLIPCLKIGYSFLRYNSTDKSDIDDFNDNDIFISFDLLSQYHFSEKVAIGLSLSHTQIYAVNWGYNPVTIGTIQNKENKYRNYYSICLNISYKLQ